MASEPTEPGTVFAHNPRSEWETAGRQAIERGGERFSPMHQDRAERERFMELFGELELEEQIEIVKGLGREELLEKLRGDSVQRSAQLEGELAVWLERNNDEVEHRNGRMARANGEIDGLTWDEHPEFIKGYLGQLVKELHGQRREGFGKVEALLARIYEGAQQAWRARRDSEKEIHYSHGGFDGWQYLTVTAPPRGGGRPDWVREAWVGVSLAIPPDAKDEATDERVPQTPEQAPGDVYLEWCVNLDDAVIALLADGKWEAAKYWMKEIQEGRTTGGLGFAMLDCELRGKPVFPGKYPLAA